MNPKILKLKRLFDLYSEATVDGVLYSWEGDLEVGKEIVIVDDEGNVTAAPNGEIVIENQKIKIEEGKIAEIEAVEAEPEPTQDPEKLEEEPKNEPEPAPVEDPNITRIKELEAEVAEKDARIADLEAQVKELNEKLMISTQKPADEITETVTESRLERIRKRQHNE